MSDDKAKVDRLYQVVSDDKATLSDDKATLSDDKATVTADKATVTADKVRISAIEENIRYLRPSNGKFNIFWFIYSNIRF